MTKEKDLSKFQAELIKTGPARPLTKEEKEQIAADWELVAKRKKEIFG